MKFNQKMNRTEDMTKRPGTFSLEKCASSCLLDIQTCQHGWAYSSSDNMVWYTGIRINFHENYNIARAMSSSRADPALGHCPDWVYLNI